MNVIRKVDVALPEARDAEVEHWLRTEVVQTYDRLLSGEEKTIPLEDVVARLNGRGA